MWYAQPVCFTELASQVHVQNVKTLSPKCACVVGRCVGEVGQDRKHVLAPLIKGISSPWTSCNNPAGMAQPGAQNCFVGRIWGFRETADCLQRS